MLPITSDRVTLRVWRVSDRDDLAHQANSRAVWRNMTHVFPHPYTRENAKCWIDHCQSQRPAQNLAIEVEGRIVGGCGVDIGSGTSAYTGTVGYWLGESNWGRGIATIAIRSLLAYIRESFDLRRLEAGVFSWNPASARVLEKNGFELEGTRRRAVTKDDEMVDEWMYSLLISEEGHE